MLYEAASLDAASSRQIMYSVSFSAGRLFGFHVGEYGNQPGKMKGMPECRLSTGICDSVVHYAPMNSWNCLCTILNLLIEIRTNFSMAICNKKCIPLRLNHRSWSGMRYHKRLMKQIRLHWKYLQRFFHISASEDSDGKKHVLEPR